MLKFHPLPVFAVRCSPLLSCNQREAAYTTHEYINSSSAVKNMSQNALENKIRPAFFGRSADICLSGAVCRQTSQSHGTGLLQYTKVLLTLNNSIGPHQVFPFLFDDDGELNSVGDVRKAFSKTNL